MIEKDHGNTGHSAVGCRNTRRVPWFSGLVVTALFGAGSGVGGIALAQSPATLTPRQEKNIVQDIVYFRERLQAAVGAKDRAKLERMYAKSFVQTHGTGNQDGRDSRIERILAGDQAVETLAAEDLVIRVYGDGSMAVATGRSRRTTAEGVKQLLAWTVVYARNGRSWEMAASQVTRLKEDLVVSK